MHVGQNSFNTQQQLKIDGKIYQYYSLKHAEENLFKGIGRLPYSLKVLFENLLRFEDGITVTKLDIQALAEWIPPKLSLIHISEPTRPY